MLTWLRVLASRLHATVAARRLDEDFDEELRTHLTLLAEELERRGMKPEAAARAARLRLGRLPRLMEDHRDRRGLAHLETLLRDLRYAARTLRRSPAFTFTAVATLALGIGVNAAMFSVFDTVLLRPLPFPAPAQLVSVDFRGRQHPEEPVPLSAADFLDLQASARSFSTLGLFVEVPGNLAGPTGSPSPAQPAGRAGARPSLGASPGEPEQVEIALVGASFFQALGVAPALGRPFDAEDDRPGSPAAVVLGDALWRRRFGADPSVIGRTLELDGQTCTIVGVMPAAFRFPAPRIEIWRSRQLPPPTRRGPYSSYGIGRLRPGVTLGQARAEVDALSRRLQLEYPLINGELSFHLVPLQQQIVGEVRPVLVVLLVAVTLILLVACANVAGLLLARTVNRRRELTVRVALGASGGRIFRQLATESLLLALLGGVCGAAVCAGGLSALRTLAGDTIPRLEELALGTRAAAYAAAVSLVSGGLCGLAYAWSPARSDAHGRLIESLKESGARGGEGRARQLARRLLVITEIALSVILLIGAGLLLRSFVSLSRVELGFQPERAVSLHIVLPRVRYAQDPEVLRFWQALLERVESLPGVEAAGLGISLPPDRLEVSDSFTLDGHPTMPGQPPPEANLVFVSPHYFRALGTPLLAGREFGARDNAAAPNVAIVNAALARRFAPERLVGVRIKTGGPERPQNPWLEIVGVVGDLRYDGLDSPARPALYQPCQQVPWRRMYLVVRSALPRGALLPSLRRVVGSLDPALPLADVSTLQEVVSRSIARPRFRTVVLVCFGALALLLAGIGLCGLIAYTCAQRAHEFGIRIALGASRRTVVRGILAEGVQLAGIGVVLGAAAALGLTRLLASLLFGVTAADPLTFIATLVLVPLAALVASLLPALKTLRVDPAIALRTD